MDARVRRRFAAVITAMLVPMAMSACSLVTTFDGLTDGGSVVSTLDAGVAEAGFIDAGVPDGGARDACTPGVTACGPASGSGTATPSSLYQCDDSRTENKIEDCQYGCVTQPSAAEAGKTVAVCSPCFVGGFYCGTDKIGTDKNTLYVCNADGTASVKQVCGTLGCRENVNSDDMCN